MNQNQSIESSANRGWTDRLFRMKQRFQQRAPELYGQLRKQYWQWRAHTERSMPEITRAFVERYGRRVLAGPFEGMLYCEGASGSALLPKLIGSYECELHPALETVLQRNYPLVVDIGCAEGYYAVGLARRLPSSIIYAFDIDSEARRLCRRMAEANRVSDAVVVRSECTWDDLRKLPLEAGLVICDCEGYEDKILRPNLVPELSSCTILVEMHEYLEPGISSAITSRFRNTHHMTVVDSTPRNAGDYPVLEFLPKGRRELAIRERRDLLRMQWAVLLPR
jgi:hypothetical protein